MKVRTGILIILGFMLMCSVGSAAIQVNVPTPDGSGQATHPDIYYNESGLFGYKYWMAFTPYFESVEPLENPSLIASNDGINWAVPDGVTNPIDAYPGDGHNSDTDLVYDSDANELRIYYRWNNATAASYHVRTYDGVSISDEVEVQTTMYGLSPAFMRNDDGTYNMWVVASGESPNGVYKLTSPDGYSFTNAESVSIIDSITADVWHMDVVKSGSIYYGIICYCDLSTSGANAVLRLGVSTDDGETFNVQTDPIVSKGTQAWNNNVIYRGTGIADSDGLVIWYGASGYPPRCWGIGVDRIAYANGKWVVVDYYGHTDEKSNYMEYSISNILTLDKNYNPIDVNSLSVSIDPLYTESIYDRISTDGLLAWYKYDNSDGSTVLDSSGNANDASKDGAFAYTTDGKYGNASMVVESAGVAYKANFNLSTSSFSVSLHSKSNENVTNNDGWIGQGAKGDCWAIGSYGGRLFASVNGANAGQWLYGAPISVGEQVGVTVTFDAVNETHTKITFYKNGKLTGYGYVNQTFIPTAKTLRLGRADIAGSWAATNVTLDNVLIYNRVLSEAEVAELYYDPVSTLKICTNSNLTYSNEVTGSGVANIPFSSVDDDIYQMTANVPSSVVIGGVTVHDYPSSMSPVDLSIVTDLNVPVGGICRNAITTVHANGTTTVSNDVYPRTFVSGFVITPTSGDINVTVSTWSTNQKVWTLSSETQQSVTHTIGDFPANTDIQIKRDDINYETVTSNETGYIEWVYDDGFSEHTFEATVIDDQPTVIDDKQISSNFAQYFNSIFNRFYRIIFQLPMRLI